MREKKLDKRKAQGAETKKKLYEIAERLFTERNFSDVNVEDITDEAGITKGAFYVHFESKDALIATLIADYASRADTDYKTFLEMLPDDIHTSEVLLRLTQKITETLLNTIGYENMKKVYQMLLARSVDTEAVKGYGRELYTLFHGVLEKGIRRGELKSSLPSEELARHFVMAIRGVSYEWCVRYPDFDLKEQTMAHIQLLIKGIQT
ncbi:TetR/AcrR family transcriptional regulator [Cellulosilyticum sp. I15G10I2]|uniref:TetR/AcrR family transcriptional regulator n=1 Tax=Cellulosilyticum sp. I15G10I2 TaxID=1892843 RepID=UPI00085CB003|nr:TetR/AcrR family transcriptional regulator [Cellulosilyticum sp. I15G10I2]